jgi:hypothetical protein
MKRLVIGAIVAGVVLVAAGACEGDPTASLRGGPSVLSLNPDLIFIDEGDTRGVEVTVRDQQLNPVPGTVSVSSNTPAVATVEADTSVPSADGARFNFVVTAVAPGQARLIVTAAALTDTVLVNVLPLAFGGAASTASPQVGQPLTFLATSVLKFAASSNVDFGGGLHGIVTKVNAETLTVVVPQPDAAAAGPLTIEDVAVTYVAGLTAALPTATSFNAITNPYDPNSAPDPAYQLPIPAPGNSVVLYDGLKAASEVDNFYSFTLSGTTTFTVQLEWFDIQTDPLLGTPGTDDIDILWCDAGCNNFVGNFAGATGANPEVSTVTLPAGTYNLYINLFAVGDASAHLYRMTITTP